MPQWKQFHAESDGFQVKIWGEDEILQLNFLVNKGVILNKKLNPALRADFLRLELLHEFGGLYADVDMTCERNVFQALYQEFNMDAVELVTGVSNTSVLELNNGVILSKPKSTVLSKMIQ